jgi:hypothetical protein
MAEVVPEGYELIPTGQVKLDHGGLTITVDMDKAPCLCAGVLARLP